MSRTYWLMTPLAALTALSLTACGGASSGSSTDSSTPASASAHPRAEAMRAYRQCLSQHGVTLPKRPAHGSTPPSAAPAGRPDPNTPPPGVDAQTWQSARAACASLMPPPPSKRAAAPSTAGS